ncbi:MAG: N-acetyltransferase family protein [Halobacteriota archaeon]
MNPEDLPTYSVADADRPPYSLEDREGRTIDVGVATGADVSDLVEMYERFDPADRAQGIPPVRPDEIHRWLEVVLEGYNVVGRHDGDAVAHSMLVDTGEVDTCELAIFVLQPYQGAGIGTRLVESAFGLAYDDGVTAIWLTVERWNHAAIRLYRKLGFQETGGGGMELEMGLRLTE